MKVAFDFYYRALSFYHIKHSRLEMSKKRHRPFIRERSMNWKTEKASDFQEFFFYVKRQGPYVKKAAISSKVYDNPLKAFFEVHGVKSVQKGAKYSEFKSINQT